LAVGVLRPLNFFEGSFIGPKGSGMLETFPRELQIRYQPPSRLSLLQSFRRHDLSRNSVNQYRSKFALNVDTFGSRGGQYV
jgi:hypothetical protein